MGGKITKFLYRDKAQPEEDAFVVLAPGEREILHFVKLFKSQFKKLPLVIEVAASCCCDKHQARVNIRRLISKGLLYLSDGPTKTQHYVDIPPLYSQYEQKNILLSGITKALDLLSGKSPESMTAFTNQIETVKLTLVETLEESARAKNGYIPKVNRLTPAVYQED